MPKRKSEYQPMARRRSRPRRPRQDKTNPRRPCPVYRPRDFAPSNGGAIPVHINDIQLRQLAGAISAGIVRGAIPSSSTEPDLTSDKNSCSGILGFPLSGSAIIDYQAGQVVS